MRSNVETRRCGCGTLLGLRDGCQQCAQRERAKLHAAGKATHDWEPGWEERVARLKLSTSVPDAERQRRHAVDAACRKLAGRMTSEPPPVGAEVSWHVAERDMRARPEARYREFDDLGYAGEFATRVIDGTCWFGDPSEGWMCKNDDESRVGLMWRREADATTLPSIGAEVTWSVAKADMVRRKGARYRPTCSPGHEYAWSGELVLRELGGTWQSADWSDDVEGKLRWERLA